MVIMMVVCRRYGWFPRVMQFDRLTVRRVEIGLAPGFLALGDFGCRGRALQPDDGFERRQPLPVVGGVGRFARLLRMGLYLGAEHIHPFVPGEKCLAAQVNGAGEDFRHPRFGEGRAVQFAEQRVGGGRTGRN